MQYCPYCDNASTISVYYKDGLITRKCDNSKCKSLFRDIRSYQKAPVKAVPPVEGV